MPYERMHSTRRRAVTWSRRQAKNVAGGKELLRTMLSKEAATNFAKTKLAADHRQGHRARRRIRLDRPGVADRDARRRRGPTCSPGTSSTSTAPTPTSSSSGTASSSGESDAAGLTSRPAGDHRQGPRGRLDQEDRGHVTAPALVAATAAATGPPRRRLAAAADLRPGELHRRVPRAAAAPLFVLFVVWPFVQAFVLLDDRLDGLLAGDELRRARQLPEAPRRRHLPDGARQQRACWRSSSRSSPSCSASRSPRW